MDFKLGSLRVVSDDIQQAEHQVKANEIATVQSLLDAYRQALPSMQMTLDGTITEITPAFCQLLGVTPSDVGQSAMSFVQDQGEFAATLQALRKGGSQQKDMVWLDKQANEKQLSCAFSTVSTTANGSKVVLLATDISKQVEQLNAAEAQMRSVQNAQATIEFDAKGTILTANENFLSVVGYKLSEIVGRHHSIFVDADEKLTPSYQAFWQELEQGKSKAGEFKRKNKQGELVWLRASYNPLLDRDGKVQKVVKFAYDISELKASASDHQSQIQALERSLATIEFDLDAKILSANQNFLTVMGYQKREILGQPHSIFIPENERNSAEYRAFWQDLNAGKFKQGEFRRIDKSGKSVWIQATYNPILDAEGKVTKVIKFATDITLEKEQAADYQSQLDAISRSQAVIEFDTSGNILHANDNFLGLMEYQLEEVKGQHHRIFVDAAENQTEYQKFWRALAAGEFQQGEFKRVTKSGKSVWIQASYNPIFDLAGHVTKVVKYASDVTAEKMRSADYEGQINAISASQAVIEFDTNGIVQNANDNFLATMEYELAEIRGKHHKLFVEPSEANSSEYANFWAELANGEFKTGEFKRVTRAGKQVWLQATYNPIFDLNGKPVKVVKYATDITESKLSNANFKGQIQAIGKSQATIEFDLDGNILIANDNFLNAMNYSLEEVTGKHHSIFLASGSRSDNEYRAFWEQLRQGKFQAGEYKRKAKDGREVWIQATYNPIFDAEGRPFKVVKFATDITEQKLKNANFSGQISAISKSQAVVEFDLDGKILAANDNFLQLMEYRESEVLGKYHSMFVDAAMAASHEYKEFWHNLKSGHYQAGEFKRVSKSGKTIWIVASYNPILDLNGRPFKVVKYATDFTAWVEMVESSQNILVKMSEGQLRDRIQEDFLPKFQPLKDAINATADQLQRIVSQIRDSADHVNRGVSEIKAGNDDLSARTEQQAASLEQTAASVEQMTSAIKSNAANSETANSLSTQARDKAQTGGEIVTSAIQSMQAISESSNRINDIISVIDEIAFQTNLLALNAAVEAARAGEQGRGFAVVAGEVRNLAQRSAGAAKEIKELIQDSVEKVDEGTKLVNRSGDTLKEIVESVMQVSEMVDNITQTAKEQSNGMTEINQAVATMDNMTQQNAALVEQATAASESLVNEANSMLDKLSFFRLSDADASRPIASAPSVSAPAKVTPIAEARRPAAPAVSQRKASAIPSALRQSQPAAEISASQQDSEDEWEEF